MKSFTIQKKHVGLIVLTAVFLASCFLSLSLCDIEQVKKTSLNSRKLPIYGVSTDKKVVALTLDCAWENSDTDILISLFERHKIPVTLFVTGDFCKRHTEDVKKFSDKGHSIQNHSYAHPHVASISKDELISDTKKCDEIITSITGKRPILYRAPYGEYSNSMLEVFETDLLHKVIQWNVDSIDWKGEASDVLVERVISKVEPGSIILFHNDTKNTPKALEQIIPTLKGQGYNFVLVQDMIYKENYTLDHRGMQISTNSDQ